MFRIIQIVALFFLLTSCAESQNLSTYERLSGNWSMNKTLPERGTRTDNYSWGKGVSVINSSIDIDLGGDEPFIRIGGMGTFPILETEDSSDRIRVVFFFGRGNFNVEYIFHFVEDNVFWIENNSSLEIHTRGEDVLFYRNTGPFHYDK